MERVCRVCAEEKPFPSFVQNKTRPLGIERICKECKNEATRTRMKTPEGRKKSAYKSRRYVEYQESIGKKRKRAGRKNGPRDKSKMAVNRLLRSAIEKGEIIKPDCCTACGLPGKIHGHHHDYSKPYDVIWLCPKCHMKEHRKYE